MGQQEVRDLVRENDLDFWLSFAIVCTGSFASFLEIREMIEDYFDGRKGEKLIHGTASAERLYIVKEKDYELIKEIKEKY